MTHGTDPLDALIIEILRDAPVRWTHAAPSNDRTALDNDAYAALVRSGLVELFYQVFVPNPFAVNGECLRFDYEMSGLQTDFLDVPISPTAWIELDVRESIPDSWREAYGERFACIKRFNGLRLTSEGFRFKHRLENGDAAAVEETLDRVRQSQRRNSGRVRQELDAHADFVSNSSTGDHQRGDSVAQAAAVATVGDIRVSPVINVNVPPTDLSPLSEIVGEAVRMAYESGKSSGQVTDNGKKEGNSLPQNSDVRDLCLYLKANSSKYSNLISCARGFCKQNGIDVKKAEDLMTQARRFSHLWKS